MRYERLVIQAGSNAFALDLHPRLTVVAGLGDLERDALVGELVGALGSSRPGVHAELITDRGRHLAVFRPEGARHRIVDVDAATDVSREFRTQDGRIDLLALSGIEARFARRRMRVGSADLTASTHGAQLVRRLASVDQGDLWDAADAMTRAEELLQSEAEAVGSAPEDAAVIERIEERHHAFETAQDRHESFRSKSIVIAAAAAVATVPLALLAPASTLPGLVLVAALLLLARVFRRRSQSAAAAEEAALAEAGAQSYLGFHLQRVDGLLSSDENRKRLMTAAEGHRVAAEEWRQLAGDIRVDWAVERREEILAAAQLRRDVTALGVMSSTAPELDDERTTDLAQALVGRLAEVRRLGADGESFPLILDDPFVDLDPGMKPSLLELLGHTAGSPQLIFLTNDEDVASWARLEALTGALAIVEPTPEHLAAV